MPASAPPASRTNVTPHSSVLRMLRAVSSAHWVIGVRISSIASSDDDAMCRWQSNTPGMSQRSAKSIEGASGSVTSPPTSEMIPFSTATSRRSPKPPDSSRTLAFRRMNEAGIAR